MQYATLSILIVKRCFLFTYQLVSINYKLISMNNYQLLQSVYLNLLETLTHLLEKAEAHVKEKGIEESALLAASIYPDMLNFTRQIQVATDDMRRNIRFLAGKEHVKMEDNETTIGELQARVLKTKDVVKELVVTDFEGADERHISLFWMGGAYVFGKDFVQQYAFQNSHFHVVTAYDILRKEGVSIGKMDYITNLAMNK